MCPWRPRERPRTLKVGTMGGAQVHPLTPTPPKHFGPLKGGGGGWDQKTPLSLNHRGTQAIFTPTHPVQPPPGLLTPKATLP